VFGELQQPSVLVLGLGESGLAMARWCARFGCRVRAADTRSAPPNLTQLSVAAPHAEFVGGPFTPMLLDGIELIAVSPGLSPLDPEVAALFDAARATGVPVWGEIELFAQALRHLEAESGYAPRILAITGTNGKTTTTSLTGSLIRRAGRSVAVAGNISPSALDKLAECISEATLPDVWVLELSSFQLETTHSLNPHAATVLNVTQDHLDWHGSMEAYAASKRKIFGAQTVRVLNRDDLLVMHMADDAATIVTFGTDQPTAVGDFGLLRDNVMPWLVVAEADAEEEPRIRRRKSEVVDATPVAVRLKRLMPADALQIRGLHNAANALAALALCRAIDLPLSHLLHGLRGYRGEPHRVEVIATVGEVEYVDDSKGTNVGATVAALNGLAKPTVLIAGGDGKGQDFSPLALPVAQYGRAVILIGRDAATIREALANSTVPLEDAPTLEAAVARAAELAQPGDVVLLSPACASLDMFRNYAHRAEVFRSAVEDVALARGIML
jgi:UDP-N-acetylmuramoylalanine--D-glutamate ligase